MSWTDERKDTLKKLWAAGLPASQIAEQLGGVTRNAVLGKVHHMGLSSRAAGRRPSGAATAVARTSPRRVAKTPSPPRRVAKERPPITAVVPAPKVVEDLAPGLATVLTLGRHMCKWPIGDPCSDGFTFCGRPTERRFCDDHASRAFEPVSVRAPRQRRQRTRLSLAFMDY